MKTVLVGLALLALSAGSGMAATCYRPNPAGGSIPYECVRGEELKVDAPSLGTSNIPTPNEDELKAIEELMNGAVPAAPPVQAAPAR